LEWNRRPAIGRDGRHDPRCRENRGPSEILVKPGALSPLERGLIQLHCEAGREILKDVVLSWPLAEIVYQHHERLEARDTRRA
jgi:hypothetical protein